MDGRSMMAFFRYAIKAGVYPDVISEGPGIVSVLADREAPEHPVRRAQLKHQMQISVEKHGARMALVAGHPKCAGYPVDDLLHQKTVREATETVREVAEELGYYDYAVHVVWNAPDAEGEWNMSFLDAPHMDTISA